MQKLVKILHDGNYHCDDNETVDWFNDYKKELKRPKKNTKKEELMLDISRECKICA